MYWFTADTHFDHKGIIESCNRPFKSVEEMNQTLIENWNRVVSKKDMVFHLGDFCFSKNCQTFTNALNGNIVLIRGNHDIHLKPKFFNSIHDMYYVKFNDIKVHLCHYPLRSWRGMHNSFHFHGHSHGRGVELQNSFDVGVDNCGFTPISFEHIMERINVIQ